MESRHHHARHLSHADEIDEFEKNAPIMNPHYYDAADVINMPGSKPAAIKDAGSRLVDSMVSANHEAYSSEIASSDIKILETLINQAIRDAELR